MEKENKPKDAETYVFFGIKGDTLDPEEVTATLELNPSRSFCRGDEFKAGSNWHKRSYGYWMKKTSEEVKSEVLEDHCKCLLKWFEPVKRRLQKYICHKDVRVVVGFWSMPEDGPAGFTLSSSEMKKLSEICNEFDFYF